ncbi:WD40 repeat domain-containing protein [Streptomyces sp. NPDC059590]|uniref:WD40 repeat domain-containing protein n=1 Tax=Streptomyces sp. NPDC059590 TaxID=3346877 RepID=UPI003688D1FC
MWDTATGTLRFAVPLTPGCRALLADVPADGSWLAITDDRDRTVRVWDTREGTLPAALAGHTDAIHSRAVSPDGTWLATAGRDGIVRVWDTATWRTRHVLPDSGTALLSSPDGTWLAAGPATGQVRATLSGHATAVDKCVATPDGSHVVTICTDGVLRLWDTATLTVRTLLTGQESAQPCAVDPDGAWLAWRGMHATQRGVTVVAWGAAQRSPGRAVGRPRRTPVHARYLGHRDLEMRGCHLARRENHPLRLAVRLLRPTRDDQWGKRTGHLRLLLSGRRLSPVPHGFRRSSSPA